MQNVARIRLAGFLLKHGTSQWHGGCILVTGLICNFESGLCLSTLDLDRAEDKLLGLAVWLDHDAFLAIWIMVNVLDDYWFGSYSVELSIDGVVTHSCCCGWQGHICQIDV